MSDWQKFLKQNKGKGMTIQQLSKKYCNQKLSQKIRINAKEGRYSSHKQAIAVSYKQVSKKYPSCKKLFSKRSRK